MSATYDPIGINESGVGDGKFADMTKQIRGWGPCGSPYVIEMKVGEQLLYLAQLKGLTEAQAMDKLKTWLVKFDIKTWWNKHIEDLSKGMQQKVQFVATVMHEPDLIILDEPFSGFDPINANLIKDEILELRDKGKTIIFSTHRMESVEELCDYIALINRSHKVLDGPKRAIKEQFKTHTYHVEYQGQLDDLHPSFTVLSTQPTDDGFLRSDIRIPPDAAVNELIRYLLDRVMVRSFGENIPSINEIFIQTVGENNE